MSDRPLTCPTCGTPVEVRGEREGTQYYVPLDTTQPPVSDPPLTVEGIRKLRDAADAWLLAYTYADRLTAAHRLRSALRLEEGT